MLIPIRIVILLLVVLASPVTAQKDTLPTKQPDRLVVREMVERLNSTVPGLCDLVAKRPPGRDGGCTRLLHGMATWVTRPGAAADRARFARAVEVQLGRKGRPGHLQAFLLRLLIRVGDTGSIPTLAGFLRDDPLAGPALAALGRIGGAEAGRALLAGLPGLGTRRVAGLRSLVGMGYDAPDMQRLLLLLAARRGGPEVAEARRGIARLGVAAGAHLIAGDSRLQLVYARARAARGHRAEAVELLVALAGHPRVGLAALDALVGLDGDKALPRVLAALDGGDLRRVRACLALLSRLPDKAVLPALITRWAGFDADRRLAVLDALRGRPHGSGDEDLLEKGLADPEGRVRALALTVTLHRLGSPALPKLFRHLPDQPSPWETRAFRKALMRLPGIRWQTYLVDTLPTQAPKWAPTGLSVLSRRGGKHLAEGLLALQKHADSGIRVAALRALGALGGREHLEPLVLLTLTTRDRRQQGAASRAAIDLATRVLARPEAEKVFLAAWQGADPPQRRLLLPCLGRLGGPRLLAVVAGALNPADDPELAKLAFNTLCYWPDRSAVECLVGFLDGKRDLAPRVLAHRALVRLAGDEKAPAAERLRILRRALQDAPRIEERRAALAALGAIRHLETLLLLRPWLGHAEVGDEARLAALKAAVLDRGRKRYLTGGPVVVAMAGVVRHTTSRSHRTLALEILAAQPKGRTLTPEMRRAGFVPLFNGTNLRGWQGLVANPEKRARMQPAALAAAQAKADKVMRDHWRPHGGILFYDGKGQSLCTAREYADFELVLEWMIEPRGDSGVYLRGSPQVQIWDPAQWKIGSGGLYNNKKHPSKPTAIADRPACHWNHFRIRMVGERVSVWLNDKLVVDRVVLENYWNRKRPIYTRGPIELQNHKNPLYFRNIHVRELPRKAPADTDETGFVPLFNGRDLEGWTGDTAGYAVEKGTLVCRHRRGRNLFTARQYGDFHLRFEFELGPGANNGLGIRAPLKGDSAFQGMELQILDNTAKAYRNLKPWQYHGSVYGVVPALRGFLKPVGEWNRQEVIARGDRITVILNGTIILDADVRKAAKGGTRDGRPHPGLKLRKGHIGFLGHGHRVAFRKIRIKAL